MNNALKDKQEIYKSLRFYEYVEGRTLECGSHIHYHIKSYPLSSTKYSLTLKQ